MRVQDPRLSSAMVVEEGIRRIVITGGVGRVAGRPIRERVRGPSKALSR